MCSRLKGLSLVWIFLLSIVFAHAHADSLIVRYVGNMGVLISGSQHSILIDGLHRFYQPAYLHPSETWIEDLMANDGSTFPSIRLLLNTHTHRDHFDAKLVHRLLMKHPSAQFMGSTQAARMIANQGSGFDNRLHAVAMSSYQKKYLNLKDIQLEGFYMNHVNPSRHHAVENIGFLIQLEDRTILHVGDTEWSEDMLKELALFDEAIDVAILPCWMLMGKDAPDLVEKWIRPRHLIATHIPPQNNEAICSEIRQSFPDAMLFIQSRQQFAIPQKD